MSKKEMAQSSEMLDRNIPGSEGGTPGFIEVQEDLAPDSLMAMASSPLNTPGSEGGTPG